MILKRGINCGSFIWGRSVHNVRIERMWVDVTKDFGGKWKKIFIHLETWYGLDIQHNAHIWLLHHLFLHDVRADAEMWRGTWNAHRMRTPDGPMRSPNQMWFLGMLLQGYHGI
ncbi:hypothetical protein CALCODRAFT_423893, partial [Calocera cornea HHB12733]